MLTRVTAYNPESTLAPLIFNVINRPDTDLFEMRDIVGLGAVKADVNTTPKGSVDGVSFIGTNTGERNIVLTLGLTPDWNDWTFSRLRRLLDLYFMPKLKVQLTFETMEFSPVEISGYIESNEPNMFSKDPEHQISIICPDPDFTSVDPIVTNGLTTDAPIDIEYEGNLDTGFTTIVRHQSDPNPSTITIARTAFELEQFVIDKGSPIALDASHDFFMNTIPGQKGVKVTGPGEYSLLQYLTDESEWIKLKPGTNTFQVLGSSGVQSWTMTYYAHFGSL